MAKKVAFLFGAGVEGQGNYSLPSGFDYMMQTILADKWLSEYRNVLKEQFGTQEYFGGEFLAGKTPYKYNRVYYNLFEKTAKNIIYQKARKDIKYFDNHFEDLCFALGKKKRNVLIKEHGCNRKYTEESGGTDHDFKNLIKYLRKEEFKKEEIKGLLEGILKEVENEKKEKQIVFCQDLEFGNGEILDAYFHSINNPVKYGENKFSCITNYYWACYFVIVNGILQNLKKILKEKDVGFEGNYVSVQEVEQYLNGEQLNYSKVMENLPRLTRFLYELDVSKINENSYYNQIAKRLGDEKDIECCGILTTNYYRFCETIINEVNSKKGKKEKIEAVYLNGQLKNFEFPEVLEVIDLSQNNDDIEKKMKERIFFPFIFGQSLVKPIVHEIQVKEYHKMANILKKADVLVIVGFNINEDDNHINAYLHEYKKKTDSQIIFVTQNDDEEKICKRLRLQSSEGIICCKVNYHEENPNEIVEKIFHLIK